MQVKCRRSSILMMAALMSCGGSYAFGDIVPSRSALEYKPHEHSRLLDKELSTSTETWLNHDPSSTQPSTYQVLSGKADGEFSSLHFEGAGRIRAGLALNSPSTYQFLYVPEMFAAYHTQGVPGERTLYGFGRKIMPWSEMDHQWQLGMWQPRFRWNAMTPEEQGLAGFFADYETKRFQFIGFVTPIYLPEQGPSLQLKDGKLSSASPYFSPPSSQINLFGQQTRVRYQIDTPSIRQIVFNPALATSVRVGGRDGFRTQLSYAYKPMNQIFMGVDGYLNLAGSDYDAVVTAHPRVLYHHLISWETGYAQSWNSSWLGVTREIPGKDVTPDSWTIQQASPATLFAMGTDFDTLAVDQGFLRVGASYLLREGGDAADSGPFASPGASLFESRFPFKEAVAMNIVSPIPLARDFSNHTRLMYGLQHKSSALITSFEWKFKRAWTAMLGGELLAAPASAATEGFDSDIISRNRANDRVVGGVTYAF